MPVQFTTELPDASGLSIGNGIEDEISVSWTDTVDYGNFDVDYKESSASTWQSHGSFSEATTSTTITGLEDGEEYDVRIRTRTEHVTGTWTPTETIVTIFPAATSLTVDATGKTTVDLSWVDNADNEDGFKVVRTENFEDGTTKTSVAKDVAPNTTSVTDDTVRPGRTYDYLIRAYTEHKSADSGSVTTTTTSLDEPATRFYDAAWRVEIDHPSGNVLTPDVVGEPEFTPKINGLPTVSIPVRPDDKWLDGSLSHADMRVWYRGTRLPIERVEKQHRSDGTAELVGKGGVELIDNYGGEWDNVAIHDAAGQVVSNATTYASNIDNPQTSSQNDELMQSADTDTEFKNNLESAIPDTEPLEVSGGRIRNLPSCIVKEGENPDSGSWFNESKGDYSGGTAGQHEVTYESVSWSFSFDYTIPSNRVGIKIRCEIIDDGTAVENIEISFNGETLDQINGTTYTILSWEDFSNYGPFSGSYDGYTGADLQPGNSYDLTISSGSSDPVGFRVDAVSVFDTKYSYNWDNDNGGSGGYLDGPETMPDAVTVEFEDATTPFNVTAGQLNATMNDTSNKQSIGISNDSGSSWITASNASTVSGSFASNGSQIRARVTLSRFGNRTTATPTTGYQAQSIDVYDLYADLDDTPVLSNQTIDAEAWEVLRDLAQQGDYIWSIETDQNGNISVEWTQPGQRTATGDADVTSYNTSKDSAQIYKKAVVYGTSKSITGESFTSNHGTWVSIGSDWVVPSKEVVRDASSGTVFERNVDYEIRYNTGEIKTLSGGSMSDATGYVVDYEHRPRGSYTSSSAGSNPRTLKVDAPNLTSESGCDQVAIRIVRQLSQPLDEAEVVITDMPTSWSVVEAVDLSALPGGVDLNKLREASTKEGNPSLRLGNRGSVSETFEDLEASIGSVARKV